MGYRVSAQAELEVDNIWWYIAKESGSTDVADRFVDKLTQYFRLLGRNPYIGRQRDDLLSNLRSFPMGKYVVLYRVDDDYVVICTSSEAAGTSNHS